MFKTAKKPVPPNTLSTGQPEQLIPKRHSINWSDSYHERPLLSFDQLPEAAVLGTSQHSVMNVTVVENANGTTVEGEVGEDGAPGGGSKVDQESSPSFH